jgi:hypothetical protein
MEDSTLEQRGNIPEFVEDYQKEYEKIVALSEELGDEQILTDYINQKHQEALEEDKRFENIKEAVYDCFEGIVIDDKDEIIDLLESPGTPPWIMNNTTDELRDDYDVALKAVEIDGFNLKYLPDRLKDDDTIVQIAIENDEEFIEFASERLKKLYGYDK